MSPTCPSEPQQQWCVNGQHPKPFTVIEPFIFASLSLFMHLAFLHHHLQSVSHAQIISKEMLNVVGQCLSVLYAFLFYLSSLKFSPFCLYSLLLTFPHQHLQSVQLHSWFCHGAFLIDNYTTPWELCLEMKLAGCLISGKPKPII